MRNDFKNALSGMKSRNHGAAKMEKRDYHAIFPSSLLLSSLELRNTKVYEPCIRALIGTSSHLFHETWRWQLSFCSPPLLTSGEMRRGSVTSLRRWPIRGANNRKTLFRPLNPRLSSQRMYLFNGFRKSTPPHNRQLNVLNSTSNQ